ncbi:MAG: phosphoribosylformylglycinamidine cyclo-ligase [Candidatus Omnitrophica bacterium]|nr:phosphoribosylformylglycinamidine cyclo-ligase [Candidatus Omnitrophota bacterium]
MVVTALESYAGVPHLKGDTSYNRVLAKITRSTQGKVQSKFGGFSALFDFGRFKMHHPILVSTTDGVGTKLDLARFQNKHDTIGIDLVAMCVNDLITCGARPLFFLDYFAMGAFDRKKTVQVIGGIAKGCREAGCALLGGETAVMPDFYENSKYDLAGFSVGVVEESKVVDGRKVKAGDVLLGLASSGFHSNGYSLLRKVFTKNELSGGIGRKLLTPTKIYVKPILELAQTIQVLAVANITGGGIYDNLPRVLPKGLGARIIRKSWPIDELFFEVAKRARYGDREMFHTFNMGIGMVVIIHRLDVPAAQRFLKKYKISSWPIGVVERGGKILIQ